MAGIVDSHVHLELDGLRVGLHPHGLEAYQQAAASLDISHVMALAMAPAGDLARTRALNDELLALREQDARVVPLCSVHPDGGDDALAEIDRVAVLGAAGLKLHPNTQGFDIGTDAVRGVVARAGERGLPVLFDSVAVADPGQPEKFLLLAAGCPQADIVLAHAFGPKFAQAVVFNVLVMNPGLRRNVYLDLSGIVSIFAGSPFADQILWVCRNHGLDRVLWGSDYPLYDPAEAHTALLTLGFTDDEIEQVTSTTARELYRL